MVQPGNDKVVNVKFTCDMVITIFFDYHLWPAMIQIVWRADSVVFQCPGMLDQLVAHSSAAAASGDGASSTATSGDAGNNIQTSSVANSSWLDP